MRTKRPRIPSAGASSCSTTKAAPPPSIVEEIVRFMSAIPSASRLLYGSSSNSSRGRRSRSLASARRRCIPAENPRTRSLATDAKPTTSSAASRPGESSPSISAANRRFSRAVRSSYNPGTWARKPMSRRTDRGSRTTSLPYIRADPALGASNVPSTRSSVLLPQPLDPSSPTASPGATRSVIPRSTHRGPNRRAIPSELIAKSWSLFDMASD